jgi:excisionase family DNA binding protein
MEQLLLTVWEAADVLTVSRSRVSRAQYDQAKTRTAVETVDSLSAIGPPSGGGTPSPSVAHSSASPDNPPHPAPQDRQSRVSAANPQDRSEATALDGRAGGPLSQLGGGRAPRPRAKPMPTAGGQEMIMTTGRIQPDVPALLYRVDEAAVALRLSRSVLYELIRTGQLRTVKAGRRRLVPVAALAEYIDSLDGAP